jgi:hypothetical protein
LAVKEKGPLNLKKLWIYGLILLTVSGLLAVVQFVFPKKTEETTPPPLFRNLGSDDIQAIKWMRGTEVVHLKKDKGWKIIQPIAAPADASVLEGVLQALIQIRPERKLFASGADLKEYGLDSPKIKIFFLSRGKWSEIQVGKKTSVGSNDYVKLSDFPDFFLIDDYLIKELAPDLSALREKKLFSLAVNRIQTAEIRIGQKGFSLERELKGWKVKGRPEIKLSHDKVNGFLSDLIGLRAKGFADSGIKDPQWGLKEPRVQVALLSDEKNQRKEILKIGKEDPPRGLWAESSFLDAVVILEPSFLKKIPQAIEDWEDTSPSPSPKKGP